MRCLLYLVTALALTASTEMSLTVEKLAAFLRSTIQLKQPDRQVAEYLHHVRLTEKLDDRTIEELQSMGLGPKTVGVLKELGANSNSLPVGAPPAPKVVYMPPAGPDSIEQAKIVEEARAYVMNYTKQLPNFICVEVTRRDVDPTGSGSNWRHIDTVTTRLSYFDQKEDYKVVLVNSQPVNDISLEKLGGTVSAGEFGSMMSEIFDPGTHTRFGWERWATLRGRRTYVFSYVVDQEFSKYHIQADRTLDIVPAYRGLVYVDRDTKMVTKITLDPFNLPGDFPIRDVHVELDYDFQKIGDSEFLLPLKALLTSSRTRFMTRNEKEFRLYRKFGTESTIKFEPIDPLPEDKTKEKPIEEKIKKP
jgi:hypothetical protein